MLPNDLRHRGRFTKVFIQVSTSIPFDLPPTQINTTPSTIKTPLHLFYCLNTAILPWFKPLCISQFIFIRGHKCLPKRLAFIVCILLGNQYFRLHKKHPLNVCTANHAIYAHKKPLYFKIFPCSEFTSGNSSTVTASGFFSVVTSANTITTSVWCIQLTNSHPVSRLMSPDIVICLCGLFKLHSIRKHLLKNEDRQKEMDEQHK